MERPKCERCNKEYALVCGWNKWLCGLCFLDIQNILKEKIWKEIDNANGENTRNR